MAKEEAINKLYATIKTKFEDDGVLQEIRCMLQTKMVAMMKGKAEPMAQRKANPYGASCSADATDTTDGAGDGDTSADRDTRIQLLHQLIMDYLHWHGYRYTAEMFAIESATENTPPVRECMEAMLGKFQHKNLPILLELVSDLLANKQ